MDLLLPVLAYIEAFSFVDKYGGDKIFKAGVIIHSDRLCVWFFVYAACRPVNGCSDGAIMNDDIPIH